MRQRTGPTTDGAGHYQAVRRLGREVLEDFVEPAVFGPGHPLSITAHHVPGEPISPAEAVRRAFEPFAVGDAWGPRWGTTWFHVRGRIPPEWAGQPVVLRLEARRAGTSVPGGEFLIFGRSDGGAAGPGGLTALAGLSSPHAGVSLTGCAAGGEDVDLFAEAAANATTTEDPMAGLDWPELRPDPTGPPGFVLSRCELAVRRPAVRALALDLRLALALADHHEPGSAAGRVSHEALAAACAALDPDDVAGTADAARAALAPALVQRAPAATNGHASGARVTAVGHAHIDTAWLWPLRETVRKCARTFATAVSLMEQFPEYRFVCSAARHLAWIEERYPELFARIAERVAAGQFVPVGGMWVEADCNMASGESLVRQIVVGKRYFAERFGVECRELWLPDAFGYTAALPQIMAAAGVDWFVSQKLSWNDTNPFPHHTFWWEGIDGTRVRAHFPPADTYNGTMSLSEVFRSARAARSLYPFGYGDGGGGPTREMLEAARRINELDAVPTVAMEPPGAFFAAVEADPAPLPVWVGDLYLEKHRGTFTSQAAIKRGNRRGEAALQAAELWTAAAGTAAGGATAAAELDDAWRVLLTNQFHDILPGSSIRWVAEEAAEQLADVERRAGAVAAAALDVLAATVDTTGLRRPAVVFNAAPFRRREIVDAGGRLRLVAVPPLGWTAIDTAAEDSGAAAPVTVGEGWMANGHLRLEWNADGVLTRVVDVDCARDVLVEGRGGNLFQLHEDRPRYWDAWDVDRDYLAAVTDLAGDALTGPVEITVAEAGGLRGAVRFRRSFGASTIDQTMVLAAGSRRLDFVTDVDWHEDHKFLKVAFPVAVHAASARFEIQFGHLARPTHANTAYEQARFEVCAQRWADVSEAGYGVALLNDCKYGYDVQPLAGPRSPGQVLRLSLLRAPTAPDPRCDRGRHRFTYALLPHAGDLTAVIAAGYALGSPLIVRTSGPLAEPRSRPTRPAQHSLVTVDDPGFVVETVKPADDGHGVVIRGYEALGGRRQVRLRPGVPCRAAVRTDLLERGGETVPLQPDGTLHFTVRPFELVTLRILP